MRTVELIFDNDCPNVEAARQQLRRALRQLGQPARWQEWERSSPSAPAYAGHYGSPTILVDGQDVAGSQPAEGADCCRLYVSAGRSFQGVPTVDVIVSALRNGETNLALAHRGQWSSWLALVPAVGVSMLPQLACPACWPAYASLLGSVGLGFLVQTKYLLPLTMVFLGAVVCTFGIQARSRRGYGPLAVGLVGAIIVTVGKFVFESDWMMWGGIALLVVASLWNTWPRRIAGDSCSACKPAGDD